MCLRLIHIVLAMLALAFSASAADVPATTVVLQGVDEAAMRERFAEMDLQRIEGIWEYPAEEMKLAIERHKGEKGIDYRIVLLAASDLELVPGTVVGYFASSADPMKYRLWLYTERSKVGLQAPLECVATISEDGTSITFEPPHIAVKVRINLVRFFTSIFRGFSLIPEKVEERLPVGFHKVYPAEGNGEKFNEIRYL